MDDMPLLMSTIRPVDVPEPYYTAHQNDSLGLNDLGVSLRELKMPHKYEQDVFDCSEKAAYAEWFLSNRGFNASICAGDRHSWVVVTINTAPVTIETAENATNSFVHVMGSLLSSMRAAILPYTLIPVLSFRSHQSCTMLSMRRLKIMDVTMIGGLWHEHHEHRIMPNT